MGKVRTHNSRNRAFPFEHRDGGTFWTRPADLMKLAQLSELIDETKKDSEKVATLVLEAAKLTERVTDIHDTERGDIEPKHNLDILLTKPEDFAPDAVIIALLAEQSEDEEGNPEIVAMWTIQNAISLARTRKGDAAKNSLSVLSGSSQDAQN